MRRIKNLGLAAVSALALTATLGVAGASASYLETAIAPTTISSSAPDGVQLWLFHTAQQHCNAPQLAGSLSGPTEKLSASAADAECFDQYTGNELKMNGCTFTYRSGAKTESGTFKGAVDIVCPAGKTIAFSSAGTKNCQVTVPAQNGLSATYKNVNSGGVKAIEVTVNAAGLKHTQVSGTYCGSLGSYSDGIWQGSWMIHGSFESKPASIWIETGGNELPPAGIAIKGSPPKLNAGTYPMTVTGNQNEGGQHVFSFQAGLVKCTTVKFSPVLSGPTAQFSVTPEYAGCTALGLPGTINMNGCTYTFNVLNQPPSGSTYAGHADIACPAGKSIEIVANPSKPRCTITIAAQTTDSGGLSFTNEAASSTIGLGLAVKGIDYHLQKGEGLGACTSADKTDGTYTGSSTLVGSY